MKLEFAQNSVNRKMLLYFQYGWIRSQTRNSLDGMSIIQIHTQHFLLEDTGNIKCKIYPPLNNGRFTPHGTARHYTARHGKTRHDTARHDSTQQGAKRHDTTRHCKIRQDTVRHETARNDTTRKNILVWVLCAWIHCRRSLRAKDKYILKP